MIIMHFLYNSIDAENCVKSLWLIFYLFSLKLKTSKLLGCGRNQTQVTQTTVYSKLESAKFCPSCIKTAMQTI